MTAFHFSLLYGKNTSVQVLDVGLITHTTSGLSLVNIISEGGFLPIFPIVNWSF